MNTSPERTPEQQEIMHRVISLADACQYEADHTHHVTRLALRLFAELQELHQLGNDERFILECAGVLHDIGWVDGWREHHKSTLNIIMNSPILKLDSRMRLIIGSIARYHRGAIPSKDHDHFSALNAEDQKLVKVLGAILRLADGLDSSHREIIRDIRCKIGKRTITLFYATPSATHEEELSADEKADLLQQVFNRKFEIAWRPI
jgi:exopolyphosphatase/guanosine-5'-triphosphate,3'-diphosphate pyrophosphatase